MRKRRVVVLGATGSIGESAAKVARDIPERMEIVGMSAHRNAEKLARLAEQFPGARLCVTDPAADLSAARFSRSRILRGEEGLIELATLPEADMVLIAIVGTGGLKPALAAIAAGKDLAVASKEILVMAGEIVMRAAREKGVKILPVDSEHNAIFQCLEGRRFGHGGLGEYEGEENEGFAVPSATRRERVKSAADAGRLSSGARLTARQERDGARRKETEPSEPPSFPVHPRAPRGPSPEVRRLILTASGGPFRTLPREKLADVTPGQALKHPTWNMGAKITIDSATLFNKGLEMIEARWLFDVEMARVDVIVHPQSIVHSMVEFIDGSTLAQLSHSDMCFPIQYAVTWPERVPNSLRPLDFAALGRLDFEAPRTADFPALDLARRAGETGGALPAVLNAANEIAVEAFLQKRISFPKIWQTVAAVMDEMERASGCVAESGLDAILSADAEARTRAAARIF